MSPFRSLLLPFLALTVAAVGLTACSKDPGPGPSVDLFLKGWGTGDFGNVTMIRTNGEKVANNVVAEELAALSGSLKDSKPTLAKGKIDTKDDQATVEIKVSQPIPGGKWDYVTAVTAHKVEDTWQLIWEPKVVHPQLNLGDRFETRRVSQTRAGVLAANGEELVKLRPVVIVGIWPSKIIGSKDKLVTDLANILKQQATLDVADLTTRVNNPANAEQFIEVITLRREVYDTVRPQLQALSGMRFNEEQRMLAESRTFGAALFGSVGPVTKEIMDANPGVYSPTDQVGRGGLQQKYDQRLRGSGGVKVVAARKAPDGTTIDNLLYDVPAVPGQPLKTTLDTKVQRAAEAALGAASQRSALVAIRISDGSILAVANKTELNLAFTAQVPPGSTFKTVTALGLLENGKVTPDEIVACPKFLTVPGRPQIQNSGQFELGNVPFSVDFYKSCNTAFASLAPRLGGDGLSKAGATVGLGQTWDLGLDAFSGKVSANGDAGEQAAAAFGQGTTIVSPVAMAGVAAAVARGQWKQPVLLLDPTPAKPAAAGPALKASTVDPLRAMMRQVVTDGTATQLNDLPGVHGKTGTAEYVTGDPTKTHAWFIGWQNDIAFAVFVEQGVKPAETALPISEAFLRGL
ncbi:penicillin-binding transpeptidase domain-containing protein [Rhizocola hellebori]|uniref:penicillin-binding transpeptidase domain-containing protein n=1 Tax=Rhizocola hellebori TaxID=1392758 RepID=UPI0019422F6D|nr:penicillin-binding transpeptidase domain-containing protein [Rhizocola hellebori]